MQTLSITLSGTVILLVLIMTMMVVNALLALVTVRVAVNKTIGGQAMTV